MVSFFSLFHLDTAHGGSYMFVSMYVWSCSFTDAGVFTSAIQAIIERSDDDYMSTNVFVKLNQRKIQGSFKKIVISTIREIRTCVN